MNAQLDLQQLDDQERRVYQSLVSRGYSREYALAAALDGVDLDTVREDARSMYRGYELRAKARGVQIIADDGELVEVAVSVGAAKLTIDGWHDAP